MALWILSSCFDKGCPAKVLKLTRHCRLALWVVRVLLAWLRFKVIQQQGTRENEYAFAFLCCFLPPRWNTFRLRQATVKSTVTHNSFRIVAQAFPRLQDNLSRNSCMNQHITLATCWTFYLYRRTIICPSVVGSSDSSKGKNFVENRSKL